MTSDIIPGNAEDVDWFQHRFSVAPMMDYTDRHMRRLHRLISAESVLYTEMITTAALVHSEDTLRFLKADFEAEEPLVLQLGGSDPKQMKEASRKAADYGYKEININVGCPSEKVAGAGCFGAALMLQPDLVAELSLAVGEATGKAATVKCRIGVDDNDSYEELHRFISIVSEKAQVKHFIIHARKAVLNKKFSPHDNRTIPPLKYDTVYRLVQDFPNLKFTINGGILSINDAIEHLTIAPGLCGVMVGRGIINSPFKWKTTDSIFYNKPDPCLSRREILLRYSEYSRSVEEDIGRRIRHTLIKPVLNLFHSEPKGKLFRHLIDQNMKDENCSIDQVIMRASQCLSDRTLDATAADDVSSLQMNDEKKIDRYTKASSF